jgi:hypothetical protein
LCWRLSKGLNGKLRWGSIGRSDTCFNVEIRDNKVKVVRSERGEEVYEANDLKQYFHRMKFGWIHYKMTNPKGMDELFCEKDLEDVFD